MSRPVVAVPLLVERVALGRLTGVDVVRTGAGTARAGRAATRLAARLTAAAAATGPGPAGPSGTARPGAGAPRLVVVGVGGGLRADLRPGDLVVADEVRDDDGSTACATGVAAALRAAGLTVHIGPVHTAGHLVDGPERLALGRTGALAVDTESGPLVRAAGDRPRVVVRAVADTPDRPLKSLHTVRGGLAALRSLSRAAPVLAGWALSKEVG